MVEFLHCGVDRNGKSCFIIDRIFGEESHNNLRQYYKVVNKKY